ncbi:hypothetical protein [Bacteriovorax sp. BSW11_IV]|uniref:hypothetical protein n=1 Tax=Bacteriovorax sp. BSW11_IV TaxID=1353529 RepID=UPI0012DE23A7|nr:hypothetical protein [Bacteriovorax sp. BSW11_IV]
MRSALILVIFMFSFFTFANESSSTTSNEIQNSEKKSDQKVDEKQEKKEEEIIEKKMITFDITKLKDMSMNEVSFIRKSIVEAVFAAKIFEITFGHVDSKIGKNKTWYEISVSHKREDNGLSHIEFYFKEKPSNQLINYISERNLPKAKVQYRSRVLVYKLMFGKWFDEKSGKLIKPEVINIKNTVSEKETENESVNEINSEQEQLQEEESVDDFSESGIKKSKKDAKEEEKKEDKKVSAAKKRKVEIQKYDAPNLNLEKAKVEQKVKIEPGLKWMSRFDYAIGYQQEAATSNIAVTKNEFLETETSVERLVLKFSTSFRVEQWIQHFHTGGVISRSMSEEEYKIKPRINLFGNFNYDLWSSSLFIGLNVEYDRLGFITAPERGGGLKSITSNILWTGIGIRYIDSFKNHLVAFEGDIKRALIANADLVDEAESVPLDGNKLHLQGRVSLYQGWGIGLSYEMISLSSVSSLNLDNTHSIYGLYLTYN